MELIEILQQEWAIRAMIAAILVGVLCGILGCFLVLRNMSLIGDALAHAILPGVFIPFMIIGYNKIGFFIGTLLAAILTSVIITWIQENVKTKNDAAIGIAFTVMFSVGVTGISYLNNQEGVHLDLKDFLFGYALGVSNEDLIIASVVTVFTIICFIVFYRYLFITTFQPTIAKAMGISTKFVHYFFILLVSLAIVSSLQTVGLILVVSMLITPASTALLLNDNLKIVIILSGILGMLAGVVGLIGAILFNTPPGPAMCIAATIFYFIAVIFAPKKGILSKFITQRNQKKIVQYEDIIKLAYKKNNQTSLTEIDEYLEIPESIGKKRLHSLILDGKIIQNGKDFTLTASGIDLGEKLVRAHRLWEQFLVEKVGLDQNQIHNDAENLEHLLDHSMMDELDQELGFPTTDPHGSPIPKKKSRANRPLLSIKLKNKAVISKDQIDVMTESELFELGLSAKMPIQVVEIGKEVVKIKANNKIIDLDAKLARKINVD